MSIQIVQHPGRSSLWWAIDSERIIGSFRKTDMFAAPAIVFFPEEIRQPEMIPFLFFGEPISKEGKKTAVNQGTYLTQLDNFLTPEVAAAITATPDRENVIRATPKDRTGFAVMLGMARKAFELTFPDSWPDLKHLKIKFETKGYKQFSRHRFLAAWQWAKWEAKGMKRAERYDDFRKVCERFGVPYEAKIGAFSKMLSSAGLRHS